MNRITVATNNLYRYNLYDSLENFNDYIEFIEGLSTATENDIIMLYINSPGGRLDIGLSIINAINSTRASVKAVVEGPSYSMASIIAVACDSLIMLDNTYLMFHNYSMLRYGKGGEITDGLEHGNKHFITLMKNVCSPFLTKSELAKIHNDKDVYIYNNDASLEKRMKRHFK